MAGATAPDLVAAQAKREKHMISSETFNLTPLFLHLMGWAIEFLVAFP